MISYRRKTISFLSEEKRIEGTLVVPQKIHGRNRGVVFFHGMTSSEKNYIPIAEELSKQGIVVMTLNIRGHGTSEGDFTTLTVNDGVKDGLAAYDFITRYEFIDKNRIGLCGASLGAAIATLVSAQRNVASLVLRVPATYTERMMKMTFKQIMTKEGQIFQEVMDISNTPPVRAIQKFAGSLLIITSERDEVIPFVIPSTYFANAKVTKKKELIQIHEATHGLSNERWRQQFTDEVVKWFTETL